MSIRKKERSKTILPRVSEGEGVEKVVSQVVEDLRRKAARNVRNLADWS